MTNTGAIVLNNKIDLPVLQNGKVNLKVNNLGTVSVISEPLYFKGGLEAYKPYNLQLLISKKFIFNCSIGSINYGGGYDYDTLLGYIINGNSADAEQMAIEVGSYYDSTDPSNFQLSIYKTLYKGTNLLCL